MGSRRVSVGKPITAEASKTQLQITEFIYLIGTINRKTRQVMVLARISVYSASHAA